MNIIENTYLNELCTEIQQEPPYTPRFHHLRGEVLREIYQIHKTNHHVDLKYCKNDKSLKNAEKVQHIFAQHPKSLERLAPVAQSYLQAFQDFQNTVDLPTFLTLVGSHQAFAPVYTSELKRAKAKTPQVFNHFYSDIAHFVEAFHIFFKGLDESAQTELSENIQQGRKEDTLKMIRLLPKFAMCQALCTDDLPKIFHKYRDDFCLLKIKFSMLSAEEQKMVENSFKHGNTCSFLVVEEMVLSIDSLVKASFRDDQATLGLELMKKSLEQIKAELKSLALPKPARCSDTEIELTVFKH